MWQSLPGWGLVAIGLASLPFWLPPFVVRLRNRAFVAINGQEGMELPSSGNGGAAGMKYLYEHPAANLRLRQPSVGLSDLFAYFLSPAHEIHQEHVETAHPHYARVASASRSVLGVPKARLKELARRHTSALIQTDLSTVALRKRGWQAARLEELFFVAFARLMYELVFREHPTAAAERIVLEGATNVIRTLKWTARRDTNARDRLTAHVEEKLSEGCCDWIQFDPALSTRERALYIQGVHLVTGVVQLSEGMAHLHIALAQTPPPADLSARPGEATGVADYLARAITESLRRWPLFGIAHRITSEPITMPNTGKVIPADTVLCFNFDQYQHDPETFVRPRSFEPSRWLPSSAAAAETHDHEPALDKRKVSSYIPFGVMANRPCPAQRMSLVIMNEAALVFHEQVACFSRIFHTRSMPCRGLCLIVAKSPNATNSWWFVNAVLLFLMAYEMVASTWRSLMQLCCMIASVKEARELKYAQRIFEDPTHPLHKPPPAGVNSGSCVEVDAGRVATSKKANKKDD